MHIAIIDVGSNNIKLEVFELSTDGHSHLIFNTKFPARLGSDVFVTHRLRAENVEQAIAALQKIHRITLDYACEATVAIATAALRECESSDFIERAKREAQISISVISGLEEARLVYNGVRAHTSLGERNYFINDIGGGSTEILVANDNAIHFAQSLRLGTVRLKEMFGSDSKETFKLLERYVARSLEPYLADIKEKRIEAALCTGGNSRALLDVLREMNAPIKEELHLPLIETKVLAETLERLAATTPKELTRFKSIDENRRDILLPGAALLLTLLKQAQINRFVVSPNGLRDGAVAEYIFNNLNKNVYVSSRTEFRETGLNAIIEKYKMDRAHSHRVAALAVQLFDAFQELHLLPTEARDLLVAAAMLHDIGKFIDYSQHHKHTLYILSNIKLHGYDDAEKQIIAHTARYHRKSSPKPAHLEYEALSNQKKAWILKLSAILRLADAFDRASANSIDTVSAQKINSQKWNLSLGGSNILALEEWALENKKEVFEKIFSIKLVIV